MNALLDGLHFARPGWFWAFALLPVAVWIWHLRRRDGDVWRSAVDAHLLPHLVEARVGGRGLWSLTAWMLGITCAVLALAGPGWRQLPAPLHGASAPPLVVALDLSSTATAADLPPTRLLQARAKLASLFAERGQGEIALLAYADDAFAVAPLTADAGNLALYLDALSPDIMPADGQRASRAIEQATRLLRQRGASSGDILLMTGNVDRAALVEAATAARMGYRVSALGLGTAEGAAYRDATGALAHARLDEAALQALAAAGGGRYRRLGADTSDLMALGMLAPRAGDATAGAQTSAGASSTLRWADQGYWLVLPVLALVLLAFRRGGAVAVIACLALLPLAQAQSQARQTAPPATAWQRADQAAHTYMIEGANHYRAGRYDEAARQWSGLPGADAAYNHGNALARLGQLDAAIEAYDEALRLQPDMADAVANRAAVDAARQREPPPGPGEDPRAPPRDGQQEPGEGAPDAGEPSPGDAPGDGAPAQQQPERPPQGSAEPPPADTDAQRDADEAQRERMERALEGRDEMPDDGGGESTARDGDEHERRQANEAWLRRLPDDPGGLLRARFRLEHERRQQEGR